ncbi:MAG TPA: hypothetical protein EYG31_01970 [Porticoccaceae bacterium]|jgi:hypothetical protein|nr:hypothetical protein [Gammaproteobacteria bacterium]HIL59386.1 hypothetical protein [Porticoccaceae bacterium]
MTVSRQQDIPDSSTQNRTERVFSENDLWYFKTREGDNVGPFRYRSEAESNLDRLMTQLKKRIRHVG